MAVAIVPGKVAEGRYWLCPRCGHKLAELVDGRAVIRSGRVVVSVAIKAEPDQQCPRCKTVSYLSGSSW